MAQVTIDVDLDEFDTNELRLLGAREAGWHIDTNFLLEKIA